MLQKYEESGSASLGSIKTPVEEGTPSMEDVWEARKQTGELLWLANKTRPDICFGVSVMSVRYSKTKRSSTDWEADPRLLEVYTHIGTGLWVVAWRRRFTAERAP